MQFKLRRKVKGEFVISQDVGFILQTNNNTYYTYIPTKPRFGMIFLQIKYIYEYVTHNVLGILPKRTNNRLFLIE